jgi:cyanobactin biosynthesis protein (PatB/AcyB/McaB family)
VRRPELVHPHRTVDVVRGTAEQLVAIRIALTHGANYNDPAPFAYAAYDHLKLMSAPRS